MTESSSSHTPDQQEAPDFSKINWAILKIDPQTDKVMKEGRGVIRLRLGDTQYLLTANEGDNPVVKSLPTEHTLPNTAVYTQVIDRGHENRSKIVAMAERPFALDDPDRINRAAVLEKKLDDAYHGWLAQARIIKEADKAMEYRINRNPEIEVDEELIRRSLAVAYGISTENIETYYPSEFFAIAATMVQEGFLGIDLEIPASSEPYDPALFPYSAPQWTPDHIRELFTPKEAA